MRSLKGFALPHKRRMRITNIFCTILCLQAPSGIGVHVKAGQYITLLHVVKTFEYTKALGAGRPKVQGREPEGEGSKSSPLATKLINWVTANAVTPIFSGHDQDS